MPKITYQEGLGDEPIQPEYVKMMNSIARVIDSVINGKERPKKHGFILMMFPFDEVGSKSRCNYISNANRQDVVVMLKEQIARFEGMPSGEGHG